MSLLRHEMRWVRVSVHSVAQPCLLADVHAVAAPKNSSQQRMPLFGKSGKDSVRGSGSGSGPSPPPAQPSDAASAPPPKRVSLQLAPDSQAMQSKPAVVWSSNSVILHVAEAAPGDGFEPDGEKVMKLKGDTFVMAWLVDDEGQPVGHPARWPKRTGVMPAWNSAREVGPIVASAKYWATSPVL